ncbi:MAG: hypothetical protein AB1634_11810 [Thermodesulfobacteriota bacterium]
MPRLCLGASYRILDLGVALTADRGDLLDLFDQDYAWFRTAPEAAAQPPALAARYTSAGGTPRLAVDGEDLLLAGHPAPALHAYRLLLTRIFGRLSAFYFLHAGVVALPAGAVILAGPPGVGKSTLVAALCRAGYSFYSDDICPLHARTGEVHPFPRSLWLAPGSEAGSGRRGKRPLIPAAEGYTVGGPPCRPLCLICLEAGPPPEAGEEIVLTVRPGQADALLADLAAVAGLTLRPEAEGEGAVAWRLRYPPAGQLVVRLRGLLAAHAGAIWQVYREDRVAASFHGTPELTPIPVHAAAFRLLANLKPEEGTSGPLPGAPDGAALFMRLGTLLGQTPCFRLQVGRLSEEVERVAEAVTHARKI